MTRRQVTQYQHAQGFGADIAGRMDGRTNSRKADEPREPRANGRAMQSMRAPCAKRTVFIAFSFLHTPLDVLAFALGTVRRRRLGRNSIKSLGRTNVSGLDISRSWQRSLMFIKRTL